MGTVYEEITLKNAGDVGNVKRGYIKEPDIRETTLRAVVDTGAITLVISEGVRQKLGLGIESTTPPQAAGYVVLIRWFDSGYIPFLSAPRGGVCTPRNESKREATMANNQKELCPVTEAVEVHWKDRMTLCQALVVPGNKDVLLGAIPLEGMDLMVNPVGRELVGAHGDKPVYILY